MEELDQKKQSKVVMIAEDGDVILAVGPEKVKLRVHSMFLKAASKPFSAMFGPKWKEGHSMLDEGDPVEVSLPEDDATALWLICAIIHHRTKKLHQTLPASTVLAVAVMADKYDCVDALKFASGNWLRPRENEADDLMLLTAAAYLFNDAEAFKEITKALILNYGGPYLALSCEEIESAMTLRVVCLLEEQRSTARLKLAEILIRGIYDGICAHKCGWSSKYAYAYLKLLERHDLWPTNLLCISKAIEISEKMPDPIPEEPSIACNYKYKHSMPEYRRSRQWSLDGLKSNAGLCLHCVRSGTAKSTCFINH